MSKKVFSMQELSSFCMSLHLVMDAGIPLEEGVSMLVEDERGSAQREIYKKICDELSVGGQINTVLAKTGAFPKYMVDMVEIGERTGNLDDVFKSLSEYYERQEQISKSIKSAVVYPCVLLVVMLFVVAVLIMKVLPVFNDVYNQLGSEMSSVALAFMNFGIALGENWYIVLPIAVLVIAAVVVCVAVPSVRRKISGLFSGLSSGKSIGYTIGYARFASAMAMTMASGMDTDESLDMSIQLTENPTMKDRIVACKNLMRDGKGFAEAVTETKLFPALFCRMLAVGVKTGSSDVVMEEIARRGEVQVSERISSLVGKIEPTLVIIMSVLIGLILLSVMLPLVNIMSSIG